MSNSLAVQMRSDDVIERFIAVTGNDRQAQILVQSVLLAVKDNNNLEKCTPNSIIKSALRAATLRLSVDPARKQAYLVPYKNIATLQPGWKGLYDMAMRTGKYQFIHVQEIKQGYTIVTDSITGFAKEDFDDGGEGGWVASFRLAQNHGGMQKSVYMTHSDIDSHRKKYSKSDKFWKSSLKQMERKTVLRQLLTVWGVFDDGDKDILAEIEAEAKDIEDGNIVDAEIEPMTAEEMIAEEIANDSGENKPPRSEDEIIEEMYGIKKSRPVSAVALKEDFDETVREMGANITANAGKRGFLVGEYIKIFPDKIARYQVNKYLFGTSSSKSLTGAQVVAAFDHITDNQQMAAKELQSVYRQAQIDQGQNSLFDKKPNVEEKK